MKNIQYKSSMSPFWYTSYDFQGTKLSWIPSNTIGYAFLVSLPGSSLTSYIGVP